MAATIKHQVAMLIASMLVRYINTGIIFLPSSYEVPLLEEYIIEESIILLRNK